MPTCLEDIVEAYPLMTFPYAEYTQDFGLGCAINIASHQEKMIFAIDYRLELYLKYPVLGLDSRGRLIQTTLVAQEIQVYFG
jgi:hypothetical protein